MNEKIVELAPYLEKQTAQIERIIRILKNKLDSTNRDKSGAVYRKKTNALFTPDEVIASKRFIIQEALKNNRLTESQLKLWANIIYKTRLNRQKKGETNVTSTTRFRE